MAKSQRGWLLLAAALLSGCSQLPLDGPAYRDISTGAVAHLSVSRHAVGFDYVLVDLSPIALEALSHLGSGSFHGSFGAHNTGPPSVRIGVGDVVQVSVFESSTGGLFLPADGGPRPANFVTIPAQTVSRTGAITVPYAGSIRASGRVVPELERDIERRLSGRAIEPQVVVSVVEQNASAVSVVGDTLNGANKFKLTGTGERVLDLISRAGGTRYPGHELFVTLQRQGRRATIHFPRLVNEPQENIFVVPGDTIYVYREPQSFVAIGALGSAGQTQGLTGLFTFDQDRLTLNEALAKAGGLVDNRANPAQVFVYRIEFREVLERLGVDMHIFPPDLKMIPVVYRANFRDPSGYFTAHGFLMRNKDVIYAANADAVEVVKFLDYVQAMTSTVSNVSTDVVIFKDSTDGRHILNKD